MKLAWACAHTTRKHRAKGLCQPCYAHSLWAALSNSAKAAKLARLIGNDDRAFRFQPYSDTGCLA